MLRAGRVGGCRLAGAGWAGRLGDGTGGLPPFAPRAWAVRRLVLQAFQLRGPRNGPRTPPVGGPPFSSSGSSAAGAQKWPPHSPQSAVRRLVLQALFSLGGPDMAPALPQFADSPRGLFRLPPSL